MIVSLTLLPDGILVMALTDGPVENQVKILPGDCLGTIPYNQLRKLGDGEHEIELDVDQFVRREEPRRAFSWSWYEYMLMGLLCFGMAVVVYYLFLSLEAGGGEVRVWWVVAWAYKKGGKWGATNVFVFMGGCFLVVALGKLFGRCKDL